MIAVNYLSLSLSLCPLEMETELGDFTTLQQNLAIAMGRLGQVCPRPLVDILPDFLDEWLK